MNDEDIQYLAGTHILAIHTREQLALWREVYVASIANAMTWDPAAEAAAAKAAANAVEAMAAFAEELDATGDMDDDGEGSPG